MRIAIPTNNPGGMEASRSDHFGHCDVFTVVEVDSDNKVTSVETLPVPEHGAGGCMLPVNTLKDAGVHAIVVGGIGARPMQGFAEVGIKVYWADRNEIPDAGAVMEKFSAGQLPIMNVDQVCGGGGKDCH
ncbi:MAG: NifB/NifX family molybdenum-iron cluster-binding protein [Thermodesulfobacteriota bacterium]|nr:NifB/NifX family molybdenum-iron cluster-binding protein [Thermodesulfobacteriota bacterium]